MNVGSGRVVVIPTFYPYNIESAKKNIEKRDKETARIIEILNPPSSKRKFTLANKLSKSAVKAVISVQGSNGRKQKRVKF